MWCYLFKTNYVVTVTLFSLIWLVYIQRAGVSPLPHRDSWRGGLHDFSCPGLY